MDSQTYELFQKLRNKNFPLNATMKRRFALNVASKLKTSDFKASNGLLEIFIKGTNYLLKYHSDEIKSSDNNIGS